MPSNCRSWNLWNLFLKGSLFVEINPIMLKNGVELIPCSPKNHRCVYKMMLDDINRVNSWPETSPKPCFSSLASETNQPCIVDKWSIDPYKSNRPNDHIPDNQSIDWVGSCRWDIRCHRLVRHWEELLRVRGRHQGLGRNKIG